MLISNNKFNKNKSEGDSPPNQPYLPLLRTLPLSAEPCVVASITADSNKAQPIYQKLKSQPTEK